MATIITERDRNLCGVLGEMKWMDGARAERLLPGRAGAEVRSALDRLTKGQRQLFRKERWMSRRGMEPAYCLTDAGHQEACQLLERELEPPPREFNAQGMEHHFGVVDLYLGLLTHGLPAELARRRLHAGMDPSMRRKLLQDVFARAAHPGWRWTMAANESRLPWRQLVAPGSPLQERYLQPDAVLEVPRASKRSFIEYESGAHTLQPVGPNKPNATMAKLKRYGDFITGVARVEKDKAITWYAAKYPDGLQPELVLVEPTERRIAHVEQVVKLWLKERYLGREPFRVKVLTPEKTVARYLTWLDVVPAPRPRTTALSEREAAALVEYFEGVKRLAGQRALPHQPLPREQSVAGLMKRLQNG